MQPAHLFWAFLCLCIAACTGTGMSRAEWQALQRDCRERARVEAAHGLAKGEIVHEEDFYQRCVREGLR